jgi:hypothetical protein
MKKSRVINKLYSITRDLTKVQRGEVEGFIIVARDEDQARRIASSHAGDEDPTIWLTDVESNCAEIVVDKMRPRVLLESWQ